MLARVLGRAPARSRALDRQRRVSLRGLCVASRSSTARWWHPRKLVKAVGNARLALSGELILDSHADATMIWLLDGESELAIYIVISLVRVLVGPLKFNISRLKFGAASNCWYVELKFRPATTGSYPISLAQMKCCRNAFFQIANAFSKASRTSR